MPVIKRLADLAALVHLSWVVLGIVSLPLLFFIDWWKWVALVYAIFNVVDWILANDCSFLQLELYLRKRVNPSGSFEGRGFMEHYLKRFFNISISRSTIILAQRIYLAIIVFIALVKIFWSN